MCDKICFYWQHFSLSENEILKLLSVKYTQIGKVCAISYSVQAIVTHLTRGARHSVAGSGCLLDHFLIAFKIILQIKTERPLEIRRKVKWK